MTKSNQKADSNYKQEIDLEQHAAYIRIGDRRADVLFISFLFAIWQLFRAEESLMNICAYSVLLFLLSADVWAKGASNILPSPMRGRCASL